MSWPGSSAKAVAVVGAGPAGASAAIKLASLGHHVVMIEAAAFPRPHVGEALSAGVAAAARALGIEGLLTDAEALRFAGSELSWRGREWEKRPAHPDSVAVDRGRFDARLRDAAVERGVELHQPVRVRCVARDREGWRLVLDQSVGAIQARFLIDATGRSGLLGRRHRERGPLLFALSADWQDAGTGIPRVKAGRDHWLWGSPVPGRGYSIILFAGRETLRRQGSDLAGFYAAAVRAADLVEARAVPGPVALMDSTSFCSADIAGEAHLRVGEAAFAIDPLSSSGVHKAMASGITAAIAANTILRRAGDAAIARDFYEESQLLAYRRHALWTSSVYADHLEHASEPFWRDRSAGALVEPAPMARGTGPVALSPDTRLERVACLSDHFVEQRLGVTHPGLERPIVYAGGHQLAGLLDGAPDRLEARFRSAFPPAEAERQLSRLLSLGVLVARRAA